MAQKGLMRILSRKDGKGTVSDDKENEKVKLTKVLEFVPARKPEQAKIGEVIRFMHNPGNGLLAYWMQGELEKRVDRYTVAKESGFTRNRFMVKNLTIINYWGDLCTIPETLTINLSKTPHGLWQKRSSYVQQKKTKQSCSNKVMSVVLTLTTMVRQMMYIQRE